MTGAPSGMRLEAPAPGSALFDAAKALGDSETRSLGLLPHAAWDDYGRAGHILVAVQDEELLGYAAYRIPRNEVRLAHLVVKPEARGSGVARALIAEISSRHGARRGIGLRCRRDWDANRAWPALGFVSIGEREGRGSQRLPLTEWWLDFGHPDLLSWAPGDSIVTAAIDANVFIDLHTPTSSAEAIRTRQVIESLADRVDLVVTPELFNELNRQSDATERTRLIGVAQTYPVVRAPAADVDAATWLLTSSLAFVPRTDQDRSDVRHIAWAKTAGVPVLITRDQPARRRWSDVAFEQAGVTICTPGALVAVVHEREEAGAYAPVALRATEFESRDISSHPDRALDLLAHAKGERRNDFERRLDVVAAARPNSRLTHVQGPDGESAAVIGAVAHDSSLEVTIARVRTGPLASTLAAQLTQYLRSTAEELQCSSIVLHDDNASNELVKAALADGFARSGEHTLVALTLAAQVRVHDLPAALNKAMTGLSPRNAEAVKRLADQVLQESPAALEHVFRPLRVLDSGIPTWIVPIKSPWATELFGYPEMLFPRSTALGLSTEHVYYKAVRAGEEAPGRILWYASAPTHQLFACSLLVDVRDGSATDLYRKYQRLGVYTYPQVRAIEEKAGQVRALNVTGTELLPKAVTLDRLRTLADQMGEKLNLVGSRRITSGLFAALIQEAHSHGR